MLPTALWSHAVSKYCVVCVCVCVGGGGVVCVHRKMSTYFVFPRVIFSSALTTTLVGSFSLRCPRSFGHSEFRHSNSVSGWLFETDMLYIYTFCAVGIAVWICSVTAGWTPWHGIPLSVAFPRILAMALVLFSPPTLDFLFPGTHS